QAGGFDRIAGDADDPRSLALFGTLAVAVDDSADSSVGPMLDASCHALDAKIQVPGGLRAGNLRVQRAPLRARLASLHTEPLLDAEAAVVPRASVYGHVIRVDALVPDFLRRGVHDLEVIRCRHAGIAVAPGHSQAPLCQLVVALELLVGDRPVDERSAGH